MSSHQEAGGSAIKPFHSGICRSSFCNSIKHWLGRYSPRSVIADQFCGTEQGHSGVEVTLPDRILRNTKKIGCEEILNKYLTKCVGRRHFPELLEVSLVSLERRHLPSVFFRRYNQGHFKVPRHVVWILARYW